MCPHECPGLSDVYGDDFEELYTKYENMGLGKQVKAQEIWFSILESQTETGIRIFYSKIAVIKNLIKRILVRLNHLIYVVRLLNIHLKMKRLCVTTRVLVYHLVLLSQMFLIKSELLVYLNARIVTSPKHGVIGGKLDYVYDQLPRTQRLDKYPQIHVQEWSGGFTDFMKKVSC